VTSNSVTATPVIDVHAHLVPVRLIEQLHRGEINMPNVEVTPHESTYQVSFNGGPPTRPIAPGLTDLARRTAWLDENSVDRQVVGGWLDIFGYSLSPEEGADWSDMLTSSLQEVAAQDSRLTALGTVPLQDPKRAAEALHRQNASGSVGIMIATRAAGRDLDDPEFTPFWEAAHETGTVVFLHPGFGGASDRYHDFGLVNGLARLEDTTVTLARLLYAGIPSRYADAKIVVAHAGAALPYVLGRLTRNHLMNKDTTHDPVESFHKLYFDSVVFDPEALHFLIGKVGAEHVLLGSDYPFPIGDLEPRKVIAALPFSEDRKGSIEGRNAELLFSGASS
jgi:aminocarboxymuconate-semialdehyde decarboxylase